MTKYDDKINLLNQIGLVRGELKIAFDKKRTFLAQEIKARKTLNELEDQAEKMSKFKGKLGIEVP